MAIPRGQTQGSWLEIAAIWAEKPSAMKRLLPIVLSFVLAPVFSGAASAQSSNSLFSLTPSTGYIMPTPTRRDGFGPGTGLPTQSPMPVAPDPATPGAAAPTAVAPMSPPVVQAGQVALSLSARFGKDAPATPIGGGLTWRVYSAKPEPGGAYKLVKEDKTPSPTLVLAPGDYIVHVGFGLATSVKPVKLTGPTVKEEFDLPAGGLRMEGKVGDVRVPAGRFHSTSIKAASSKPATGARSPNMS